MDPRILTTCGGRLIASAELADAYGYDREWYDHVFLFKNHGGYELLVVSRHERYDDDGVLAHADAQVDVTALPSARALEDVVAHRWPASSLGWWRLLARAQEYDPDLYQLWIPERMKRDLELFSVHDQDLATRTDYVGGHALDAPGRRDEDWREEAVAAVADQLGEHGWLVRHGPELSEHIEARRILPFGTEAIGSLWATRYGREVALVVRVDDCGEIYARLAEPDDILAPPSGVEATNHETTTMVDVDGCRRDAVLVGDALEDLLDGWADRPDFESEMER